MDKLLTRPFFFRKIEKSNSELREEKFIRRLEITDLHGQMDGISRVEHELKEVNKRPHGFILCLEMPSTAQLNEGSRLTTTM